MYEGERFNSITHLIGAVLAIVGMVLLIVSASLQGDPWKIVSFSIYGLTLVLLYSFSTLYHCLRGKAKDIFHKLDHLAIYLLIAGTYTPFSLVTLQGAWGWSIFGVVWGMAVIGIVLDLLPRKGLRILPVIIYIIMGWVIIIAFKPLSQNLSTQGLYLLTAGGIFYTAGVVFYALGHKVQHFHGVWHLFVLAGSIAHYCTVFFYIS